MVYSSNPTSVSSGSLDANLVTANMVLPHQVENQNKTKDYGRFVISPLESGYGLTLGNALRRVLLSSLPGAGRDQYSRIRCASRIFRNPQCSRRYDPAYSANQAAAFGFA